jgi:outer membrane protein
MLMSPALSQSNSTTTTATTSISTTLATDTILPVNSLRTTFNNLTIDDCLKLGLAKNLNIQMSRENVKISASGYRINRQVTDWYTSLSGAESRSTKNNESDAASVSIDKYLTTGATISAGVSNSRSKSEGSDEEYSASADLTITQPLLKGLGGTSVYKTAKGLKILDAEYEITKSMQDTRRNLIYSITAAFYRLIGSQRNIETAQQAVDEAERVLKVAKVKKEEGMVAKIDVTRSEVQLASKRAALISTQRSYQSSLENFVDTLGLPSGSDLTVDSTINFVEREINQDQYVELAFKNRMDYRTALLNLEKSKISLMIANRNRYPELDASLSYEAANSDDKYDRAWKLRDAELTGKLSWSIPLWTDATQLKEYFLQAQSNQKIAELNLEDTKRGIVLEVRQAIISVDEARENLGILKESVKQADEALRLAKRSYEEGLQTYLDVLDSQNSYTSTQNSYTSALFNYLVAISNLDKVVANHPMLKEE